MGTPETSREPCPDRILDDLGGAFAMGAVGGSVFHFIKGTTNSPRGERLAGGLETMRMNAPRTGGGFAVWGGLFSTFDCTMVYFRQKEDPWNSILAGAATGGFLQMRQGLRSASKSAAFGGVLLALIEGAGIMLNRVLSPPPQPQVVFEDPNLAAAAAGGGSPGFVHQKSPPTVAAASASASASASTEEAKGSGWLGGWFGGEKKKQETGSASTGSDTKVLESFDSPTPMPNFDYK